MKPASLPETLAAALDGLMAGADAPPAGAVLGVACSGGLDSTVLLHALKDCLAQAPGHPAIWAIHFDHGIRSEPERQAERDLLLRNALALGVPLLIGEPPTDPILAVAERDRQSIEAVARERRHAFFEAAIARLGLWRLALAHHEDDCVEQQVMGFFRGQSEGQAIPAHRGRLWRPLLAVPRQELLSYAKRKGLAWHEDSSNASPDFLRNRLRQALLPVAGELFPGMRRALAALRERRSEDEACLEGLAAACAWQAVEGERALHLEAAKLEGLPFAIAWRVVRRGCLELLKRGWTATLPGFGFYRRAALIGDEPGQFLGMAGLACRREGASLLLGPDIVAPRKKGYLWIIEGPGSFELPGFGELRIEPDDQGQRGLGFPLIARSLRQTDLHPQDQGNLWQRYRKRGVAAERLGTWALLIEKGIPIALLGTERYEIWFGLAAESSPRDDRRYRVGTRTLELDR